jgi:hypothetical protein
MCVFLSGAHAWLARVNPYHSREASLRLVPRDRSRLTLWPRRSAATIGRLYLCVLYRQARNENCACQAEHGEHSYSKQLLHNPSVMRTTGGLYARLCHNGTYTAFFVICV